jgi:hypothetical protein
MLKCNTRVDNIADPMRANTTRENTTTRFKASIAIASCTLRAANIAWHINALKHVLCHRRTLKHMHCRRSALKHWLRPVIYFAGTANTTSLEANTQQRTPCMEQMIHTSRAHSCGNCVFSRVSEAAGVTTRLWLVDIKFKHKLWHGHMLCHKGTLQHVLSDDLCLCCLYISMRCSGVAKCP